MKVQEARGCEGGAADRAAITQQEALQRLHSDLQALSKRQLRLTEFELRWPAAQSAQWQTWQPTTPEDADFCLDLTCLLAYYAVDYSTNVERLAQLNNSVCKRRERSTRGHFSYLGILYAKADFNALYRRFQSQS